MKERKEEEREREIVSLGDRRKGRQVSPGLAVEKRDEVRMKKERKKGQARAAVVHSTWMSPRLSPPFELSCGMGQSVHRPCGYTEREDFIQASSSSIEQG